MPDNSPAIAPLCAADVPRVAQLLAAAFVDDPAYRYLFPERTAGQLALHDFFARNLRAHLPLVCSHVLLSAEAATLATVTLRPPGGLSLSLPSLIARGLAPFLFAHGPAATRRLLWLKQSYDRLEREAVGGGEHCYVHMMAVRPELQGRALGSALLGEILARNAARVPCVLTTHFQRNVVFYRRFGFEVSAELRLRPPGSEPYTVWSMVRPSAGRVVETGSLPCVQL
jgi:GNAT superfamily N-acetyltransferase